MKRYIDKRNNFGRIWSARTRGGFTVSLFLERSYEKYDGDDEGGEIQAALDNGDMVTFDSKVSVEFDDAEIGHAYLGNSVYKDGETAQFIKDGYFKDMLSEACDMAREHVASLPKLRAAA